MVEPDTFDTILFAFKWCTKPHFSSHTRAEAAGENSKSLFSQQKAAFSSFSRLCCHCFSLAAYRDDLMLFCQGYRTASCEAPTTPLTANFSLWFLWMLWQMKGDTNPKLDPSYFRSFSGSFTAAPLAKRPILWHSSWLNGDDTHRFKAPSCLAPIYRQLASTTWHVLLLCAQLRSSLEIKCSKVEALSLALFMYVIYFLLSLYNITSKIHFSLHAEAASHCFTTCSWAMDFISKTCTREIQPCTSLRCLLQVCSGCSIPHHPTLLYFAPGRHSHSDKPLKALLHLLQEPLSERWRKSVC